MKCGDAQDRLVEALYGELPEETEARVRDHLSGCDSCRTDMEKLEDSRRELDTLPQPDREFDFNRLYRAAAGRSRQSRRHWRRLAVAACAAAVLIATAATTRLHFEWRPGQVTMSWGDEPIDRQVVAPEIEPEPDRSISDRWKPYGSRLGAIEEVVRLLTSELDASDLRHAAAVNTLQRELSQRRQEIAQLGRKMDARWQSSERNIRDLYLVQFQPDPDQSGEAIP